MTNQKKTTDAIFSYIAKELTPLATRWEKEIKGKILSFLTMRYREDEYIFDYLARYIIKNLYLTDDDIEIERIGDDINDIINDNMPDDDN